MDLTKLRRMSIRLRLVLVLAFSIGLLSACSSEGGDGVVNGGAPSQVDPANETNWEKMVWDTGKWGK